MLTDTELRVVASALKRLEKMVDVKSMATIKVMAGLTPAEHAAYKTIALMLTKQPQPTPYCTCTHPHITHWEGYAPFCNSCYGIHKS